MSAWLAVALGGSIGAVIRVAFSDLEVGKFPAGIFFVNLVGCFLIGLITATSSIHDWPTPVWRSFLIAGLFGGLTTFSTFGLQAVDLTQRKEWTTSFLYIAGSVLLGMLAVWIGLRCGAIGGVPKS
jgi:CrcB protein